MGAQHKHLAAMLTSNMTFEVANKTGFDFLTRPLLVQVSRWDRLKGFRELMLAFLMLKS